MSALLDTGSTAKLSSCGLYRYELGRRWADSAHVCWVMLNPSTADAEVDDNTIKKCIKFSHSWGFGGLIVVNLFAYRATQPAVLKEAADAGVDPVGPENDDAIWTAVRSAGIVIAAWGKHGSFMDRDRSVAGVLSLTSVPVCTLALNGDGSPKHPLYIKGDTKPQPWEGYP